MWVSRQLPKICLVEKTAKRLLAVIVVFSAIAIPLVFAASQYSVSLLVKDTDMRMSNTYLSGWSVSSAGDVNGDGYDDFLVGAPDARSYDGAAYLFYGNGTPFLDADLSTAVEFTSEADSDKAGYSVSSAGDVNGDGYGDLLIGAYQNDDGGSNAGAAYLIYGQADALTSASLSTAVEFKGEANNNRAGYSVSSAGDVNGDGYDDFLVGAYANSDGASNAGAAYLIYGQADALTSASLSTAVEFTGEVAGGYAGYSVSSAGDVNGDGYPEILIMSTGNTGTAYIGYLYVDADGDGVLGSDGLYGGNDIDDNNANIQSASGTGGGRGTPSPVQSTAPLYPVSSIVEEVSAGVEVEEEVVEEDTWVADTPEDILVVVVDSQTQDIPELDIQELEDIQV